MQSLYFSNALITHATHGLKIEKYICETAP